MEDLVRPCEQIAMDKAKQSVEKGEYQQHLIDTQISSGKNADLDYDAKVKLLIIIWILKCFINNNNNNNKTVGSQR